ncbi:MAG: ribbon-helix-helix domain-containing protein [Chloroflexi bacterium]|nr:ribbon-helix-helix domain-containing protein [Chloroflexota bacterium]
MFTERTQVLLSREQRERLERVATREGRSVGSVIHEAVDAYTAARPRSRAEAAAALIAMEPPVGDWEEMKAEIVDGALAGLPDRGDSSR